MALANNRFQVKLYPTAIASDQLFYEVLDEVLPSNKKPEYGDKHWDPVRYPYHKLVFIDADGRNRDGKQVWWYAADREHEDCYNWAINQGEELIRAYLVPRHLYFARLKTEADAVVPPVEHEFIVPIVPTPDIRFPKFGFADDTVIEAPENLKSLYVVLQRRWLRPIVHEIHYDDELGIRVRTTYTLVPAWWTEADLPPDELGKVYELLPVNIFHSRMVTREVVPEPGDDDPPWTLDDDYERAESVRINIPNLPLELVSIGVVWNSSHSIGTQNYVFYKWTSGTDWTLAHSAADEASSSAALDPELQLHYRDVEASNLPATQYTIFVAGDATEEKVLARLSDIMGTPVLHWPVFRPEISTINTNGQSIKVSAHVSIHMSAEVRKNSVVGQGWDTGDSDDFSVNLTNGAIETRPCIHGVIPITGGTAKTQLVAAAAAMSMYNSVVGTITSTKTKSGTASGIVTPTSLPAVQGQQTIPTSGYYAISIDPGGNFMGYTKVVVTVFNAQLLAP